MRPRADPLPLPDAAPPTLDAIARWVADLLDAAEFGEEAGGVLVPREAPVRRLGLALDPAAGLAEWTAAERLDALLLHRHWGLEVDSLPPATGVLASHRPFDERMTLGWNRRLAAALGMRAVEPLGSRDGRPIGMCGDVDAGEFDAWVRALEPRFGGLEAVVLPTRGEEVGRIAAMGAMTDALVREAAARGAGLFLTGQFRAPARAAVAETGIGVVAVGHRRSELWGLRELGAALRERWPGVAVVVRPEG